MVLLSRSLLWVAMEKKLKPTGFVGFVKTGKFRGLASFYKKYT